jgi:hypothetical protein
MLVQGSLKHECLLLLTQRAPDDRLHSLIQQTHPSRKFLIVPILTDGVSGILERQQSCLFVDLPTGTCKSDVVCCPDSVLRDA